MSSRSQKVRGLVMSTGRTATVFLQDLLSSRFPNVVSLHEPPGSRETYLEANFRAWLSIDRGPLAARYRRRFDDRVNAYDNYIELNPFLCPLADVMAGSVRDIDVVHITRDPATWVASMIQHGAMGWRKHVIRFVPFHTPIVNNDLLEHARCSYLQRMLWRWQAYNDSISELDGSARSYTRLRYEDLFDPDEEARLHAMRKLFHGLGLDEQQAEAIRLTDRMNQSRGDSSLMLDNWCDTDRAYYSGLREAIQRYGYEVRGTAA